MGIRHSYPVHRPKEGYREDRNSDSSLANAKVSMWCCCKPRSKKKKSESVDQDSGVTSSKYRKFSSDIENHGVDGNFQHELNSLKSELDKCRIELKECQEQKESLLLRLSELMGKRLQENNPQIANLNDPNRPQKLAEMLDHIYNNEWTDAFMNLTTQLSNEKEREAIEILFDLLKITYDGCLKLVHKLYEHVQDWCKENEIECEKSRILDFVVSIAFPMQYVIETQINKVVVEKYSEHVATICKDYLQRCVIICFYMAVKSPEVYLQFDCPPEQIDKSSFKTYTNDGEAIDFIVWPPLFLFKGGSLMAKGVAQYREKVLESVSEPS